MKIALGFLIGLGVGFAAGVCMAIYLEDDAP